MRREAERIAPTRGNDQTETRIAPLFRAARITKPQHIPQTLFKKQLKNTFMTKQNLIKRFFARFMRARAASAAPAFFFAAAAAGFALAPLDASAAKIDASVETGSYGTDTDQSLAVGSGNITIGGDASVNVTETTLLTGTQLTISSTSETLDFGNVTFQQPVASDSITVSGGASVAFDKVAAGTGYGKIEVADGAKLVINGDANLSAITAEDGELTVKRTATVETLTAKPGAKVTLEAADASGVNSLVMAGGTVNVKNFTLDNVDGNAHRQHGHHAYDGGA